MEYIFAQFYVKCKSFLRTILYTTSSCIHLDVKLVKFYITLHNMAFSCIYSCVMRTSFVNVLCSI
jgi:hypothetical protein